MRNIFFIGLYIAFFMLSFNAFAQNSVSEYNDTIQTENNQNKHTSDNWVFKSVYFEKDYADLLFYKNIFGNECQKCADSLANRFPLDKNNVIHFEYIVIANDNLDIGLVLETSINWFNYEFTSAVAAIQSADNNSVIGHGTYTTLATKNVNAVLYLKTSFTSADTDIVIKCKENRIKIDVYVRHYKLFLADSAMRAQNNLINIVETYPFNQDSENKKLYSQSFINACTLSMEKVESYIEFLNNNYSTVVNDDENW